MSTNKKTIIHWFRKGLRVHDNPALVRAFDIVRANPEKYCLRPIFILDPHIKRWLKVGPNRWRFLQESLQQLHENLLNCNTRLYVVRGNPQEVFPKLFDTWNVEELTFESDIEPYSIKRDNDIEVKAFEYGVKVYQFYSHTVYNPQLVLQKNGDKAPVTYQKFLSIVEKIKVAPSLEAPVLLPDETHPVEDNFEKKNKTCYDFPTLDELLPDQSHLGPRKFPGGETEALSRMEMYLQQTEYICKFEKPNTSPNSLEPSTTVLSPYLKFGCLSSRLFFHKLNDVLHKNPKHSKPPTSLLGQLMWREFYYTAAASDPNFDKMVGNKFSYQIPWQCNTEYLEAWSYGKTGYPFIDAIMRQLRQEGWIHHLARHAVACFLTRGDLWISWEEGQKVFEELLLDADWALNAGNWMWLSASAFFYKYFRVYSPVAFGKKTDPEGKYIKRYCPELKKYPAGIIYEPWKASLKDQKEYGCVLGKDYPHRIVIHETIHKENLSKMAKAYKFNKELKESGGEILQGKRKIKTPANSSKTKKSRR